jgi:hypothetical protein
MGEVRLDECKAKGSRAAGGHPIAEPPGLHRCERDQLTTNAKSETINYGIGCSRTMRVAKRWPYRWEEPVKIPMKNVLIAATVFAVSFVFQTPGYAQDRSSPAGTSGKPSAPAVTTSDPEALQYSVLQWQPCCVNLLAGFNLAFSTTLTCPTSGCTFGFQDMIQVGQSSAASNHWAICALVDNSFVNPPCPFQGIVPTGGFFAVGNSLQNWHASAGAHKLDVYVYVDAAASLGNSEANSLLYIP